MQGVHIPPSKAGGDGTLILSFPGNGWNSQEAASYIHELYPELHVIGFKYRGYPPSTGKPSAKALLEDAPLIYDFAQQQLKPPRTVAVGFSVGTGVAAHLAGKRSVDGLILVSPFDSLKAVASSHIPGFGIVLRHEMNAAQALKNVTMPIAIIAGGNDTLVHPARTQALRKAVRNITFDQVIDGAGHNDIYHRPAFDDAMRRALASLKR